MLTQAEVMQDLNYDKETGLFTWKLRPQERFARYAPYMRWNGQYAGKIAGTEHNGYIKININRNQQFAHRLVWLYVYGRMPNGVIDHINGIGTDNRLINLREGTQAQNKQNMKTARCDNKLGLLGVRQVSTNCFTAELDGCYLGSFRTAEEAHECYLKFKRECHEFNTL